MTPPAVATEPPQERLFIAREKAAFIARTARATSLAVTLGPLVCGWLFRSEVPLPRLLAWLAVMALVLAVRAVVLRRLAPAAHQIADPWRDLRIASWLMAFLGSGWGLGWLLLVPDLSLANRLLYLFITSGILFSAMFGYAVHRPTFFSLCLPIFLPALGSVLWPSHGIPWPVAVGLAGLFLYVLPISAGFARTFEGSIRLRLRNEKLYAELAAERDASVAANVAKSRFIASASHDLRQPMHALNIHLDALDAPGIPAPARAALQRIRRSVTNLNQMFEALLDISRLDSFGNQPAERLFRLPDLAAAVAEVAAPLAARKFVGFRVEGLEEAVRGDEKMLRQLLLNLLANAIAYTSEGEVGLRFLDDGGRLTLEVHDTGCGISAEDRRQIFTEFFRVDSTRSLHEGLGLGLPIVKRVCGLIDAAIEVESEPGRGSLFRVRTPYVLERAPSPEALPLPVRSAVPSIHGKWIAVIDDDANIVEAYREAFARRGAYVAVLPEDPRAMDRELAELSRLDLIVTDYRLRHTTGEHVIQHLRESFNEDIPAVIVTADTSPGHTEHFRRLQVEVVHKPLPFRALLDVVETMLLQHEAAAPAVE